jgi:hypothetical protein
VNNRTSVGEGWTNIMRAMRAENPRKDALTFFDSNCADNKNNKAGELKESSQYDLS